MTNIQQTLGFDLSGHTFWEFTDPMNLGRPRRIVHYPRSTHYGEVALSPAWLQWLRKTRPDPPSVAEQQLEIHRQSNLKQLAAQADQRWQQQESYLDKPEETGQPEPLLAPRDKGGYVGSASRPNSSSTSAASSSSRQAAGEIDRKTQPLQQEKNERESKVDQATKQRENPWAKHAHGPSEGWQPKTWSPGQLESR